MFKLGVHVGQMSRANCVSLIQIAKSGTLNFPRHLVGNNLADGVVRRLHGQAIIERISI